MCKAFSKQNKFLEDASNGSWHAVGQCWYKAALSHKKSYTRPSITSNILAETRSDLSTISRFLCLSLLASRMASHFCKSASLQGPGVKLMGGKGVPSFQDWILRVSISSFFCRYEGTNTLQLLLFSLDGHVLSSTQRNFAWISGGRVQGSGKGTGWYLSGAPDRGTSFFCAGIRRTIMSSFSRSGSTISPSLHCRIISRSTGSSCSENLLKSSKARKTQGLAWKAPVFLTKKSSFSKSGSRNDISESPLPDPDAYETFFLRVMSLGPAVGSILTFVSEDKMSSEYVWRAWSNKNWLKHRKEKGRENLIKFMKENRSLGSRTTSHYCFIVGGMEGTHVEERLACNAIPCDFAGYHLNKHEQSVLLRKGGHHKGQVMGLEQGRLHTPPFDTTQHSLSPLPRSMSHSDLLLIPEKQPWPWKGVSWSWSTACRRHRQEAGI